MDCSSGPSPEKRIADLHTVLNITRELSATTELLPLLQKVERAALEVLNCERAAVFVLDREKKELYSRLATGVDEIRFSAERGIAGEAVRTGEPIHVLDAYADARFNPEIDRRTGFRTRNMLTLPLVGLNNAVVGVLQLLNKVTGAFDAWDQELATTFGAQVGVALQRQLLLEHYAEKQKMERELNIAKSIQEGLLPTEPPRITGFDVAGWSKPADQTGGDCFDYYTLDDGSLAVTIADATGHGIAAALVIAECRALFRAVVAVSGDLMEVVRKVNNLLCDDLPDDRFATAFFGLLDPSRSLLTFVSAGHGPLLKYVAATDRIFELAAGGVPLGIVSDAPFDAPEQFSLAPGDMMVLVTDGFFEWANKSGEQFGIERLAKVIRENRARSSAEIIQAMHAAVLDFNSGTPQADDLTALIIKKT